MHTLLLDIPLRKKRIPGSFRKKALEKETQSQVRAVPHAEMSV